ncbi:MAG: hypothetical protein AAFU77_12480 [Myxococcota bacterium]
MQTSALPDPVFLSHLVGFNPSGKTLPEQANASRDDVNAARKAGEAHGEAIRESRTLFDPIDLPPLGNPFAGHLNYVFFPGLAVLNVMDDPSLILNARAANADRIGAKLDAAFLKGAQSALREAFR